MKSLLFALLKEPEFGRKDLWARLGLRLRFFCRFVFGLFSLTVVFFISGWMDFFLSGGAIFGRFFLMVFGSFFAIYLVWCLNAIVQGQDNRLKSPIQRAFLGIMAALLSLMVILSPPPGEALRHWQHSSYSWRSDVKHFYSGLSVIHFLREKCRQIRGQISHKRCVCEVLPQISENMEKMQVTLSELPQLERAGVRIRPTKSGWVIYNYAFAQSDWSNYIEICNN